MTVHFQAFFNQFVAYALTMVSSGFSETVEECVQELQMTSLRLNPATLLNDEGA